MQDLQLSGLFVAPLAGCVASWIDAGKLDDDDLDRILTSNARAMVDAPSELVDWIPLEDVESLVRVVAGQLGAAAGLVEWVESVVGGWSEDIQVSSILHGATSLIDGTGYVVALTSERLIREANWRFEGSRERFSVRLLGLESASTDLKALLGAFLSRLAQRLEGGFDDLRFEGVDDEDLCIFGERSSSDTIDGSGESRLHRAALIA
jgi:hypothetical protein